MTIGIVTAPHGVAGAVRVMPTTDFPERFRGLKRVFIHRGGARAEHRVERVGWLPKGLVTLKFQDVADRDAADALRNAEVQVPITEVAALPEDHFYVFDLVGCDVLSVDGTHLGRVKDVYATGANDVLAVERETGRELLIPALKSVVKELEPGRGRIVVDLPAGLVDVYGD